MIQSKFYMQGSMTNQLKLNGLNTFIKHLDEVGLTPTLASEGGPFTVFALTDEAFQAIHPDMYQVITARGWRNGISFVKPFLNRASVMELFSTTPSELVMKSILVSIIRLSL